MDSSVLLVDEDLRCREVAGELFERMGHAADDIAGQQIGDVFPSEPAETLRERYSVALQGELSTFSLEDWETEFQVQTAPIRNAEGDVTGAMGLFLDPSNWLWYADALDSLGQWVTELLETKSEDELFETLLEVATERLDLFGATVYRFDEETATLTPEAMSIERPNPDPIEPGDHIVESIVHILLKNIASREEDGRLEICLSVTMVDDHVEIHTTDCTEDFDLELGTLEAEDIMNLETDGMSVSDFYLLEGFVDGYGGSMHVKTDEAGAVDLAVEFPLQQSIIDDAVGILRKSV